jgi:hypothetical protein
MADIIAQYNRPGFSFKLYPNRIEIISGVWIKKKRVIPLRNIASADRHAATNRLTIHTNDGKKETFVTGPATGKIYAAIMDAL